MRRRLLGAVVALAVVPVGVAATGVPAALGAPAGQTVTLPGTFRDMVVDPATGRVFVAAADVVVVYDAAGALVATVPNQLVASGLAIDGGSVYVALATLGRHHADLDRDLAVTGSWTIGRPVTDAIAVSGGTVWFVSRARASTEPSAS